MKRIFIAIPIPDEITREIGKYSQEHDLPVRWLEDKNLHITLVPPQDLSTDEYEKVSHALFLGVFGNPFDVTFDSVAYGSNPKSPRLIWVTGQAPQRILELKTIVEKKIGFTPKRDGFTMHITLARFKAKDYETFATQKLKRKVSWKFTVERIVIMESKLHTEGADYTILKEFKLGHES